MFKTGVMIIGDIPYNVYEVMERGFYRLDITKSGTPFNTVPEDVLYSRVEISKRKFCKGDGRYYEEFQSHMYAISKLNQLQTISKDWTDKGFEAVYQQATDNIVYELTTINGLPTKQSYVSPEFSILLEVSSMVYDVKVRPLDFFNYTEITLDSLGPGDGVDTGGEPYYPLSILRQKFDIAHIEENDFVVADTEELAMERLMRWADADVPIKSFDTETTGLEVHQDGDDKLVGVVLSYAENEATYFPFRHKKFDNLSHDFLDKLAKVVKKQQHKIVAHNKKFDQQIMMKEGYKLRFKYDTMILSIILNPVMLKGAHSLKELILKLIHKYYLELTDIFTSPKLIDFSILPKELVRIYACPDPANTIKLYNILIKDLPAHQKALFEYECRLADIKCSQEFYGMRVDIKKFIKNCENNSYVLDMLLKAFRMLTHEDGNIGSAQVLSNLMYNKMGCPILSRTKTGQPSTASAAINKLAAQKADKPGNMTTDLVDKFGRVVISAKDLNKSRYPALLILSKYKEYNKRKTAFYARFERTIRTGRIYFWINQNGAASGRQSSPMHQLPPELKDVIISDTDNHDLSGPDYSQVELRMIAWLANEKDLIEKCCDPGNDIHRIIDSLISGLPMWSITAKMRSMHKRRNFGVVYLISEYGLAGQIYGPGYTKEQVKEAKQQLDDFYNRFKRIKKFIRENGEFVLKNHYMQTSILGRIRPFPQLARPDITSKQRSSYIRQANNMPVQGTAADLLKIAECNIEAFIEAKGWDKIVDGYPLVRQMLSIHDEILISHHQSIPYEEIMEMVAECMEISFEGAPPFFASPAKMSNWGDHSNDSIVVPVQLRNKLIADYKATGKSVFRKSYFSVNVPREIVEELESFANSNPVKVTIAKYLDKVTFSYICGDWHTELTQKEKEEALKGYVESGKTKYVSENYVDVIDAYRDNELHDYMQSLIAQYGVDVDKVSDAVRHPTLTHDLIDRASSEIKDIEKQTGKDLTQVERIHIATEKYLKELGGELPKQSDGDNTSPVSSIEDRHEKFFEEAEALVNLDAEGNVVFASNDDEMDFEDDSTSLYDDEDFVEEMCEGKIHLVWETAYEYIIDCSSMASFDDINKVLAYVYERSDPDGFFNVRVLCANQLVDTKMKVEELDKEELTQFMLEHGATINTIIT